MDKTSGLLGKPLVTGLAGLVLGLIIGLIIGLPVLGWGLWPVEYKDADVAHLRNDLKQDYARMMVDSYKKTGDKQAAINRFKELGTEGSKYLLELQKDFKTGPDAVEFGLAVGAGTTGVKPGDLPTPKAAEPTVKPGEPTKAGELPKAGEPTKPVAAATAKATPAAAAGGFTDYLWVFALFCFLTLVIGGALVYMLVLRKGKKPTGPAAPARQAADVSKQATRTDFTAEGQEQPVAQFMTTYMIGDDLYDDSFSIDSPSGEFLGECGVGISEAIGVGEPKKVTAFEIWLFDKNDIQTVTKVLMSENAFNDPAINQRLTSKGEPVQIEAGKKVLLQTATLQLEARVVDASYGQGALPANSFFDRVTLELAIWPKPKA